LVSGLITERGVCAASEEGILSLFPEYNINWWFELMIWTHFWKNIAHHLIKTGIWNSIFFYSLQFFL
jgi:hypothetical protein